MEQTRARFIKNLLIGAGSVPILLEACKRETVSSGTSSTMTGTDGTCTLAPTETEGPFPFTADGKTRSEISNPLNRSDVRNNSSDGVVQTGIPLSLEIIIVNTNDSCSLVENARVDIWHCNRNGFYSGYDGQNGGLSGSSSSYVGQDFLRGYQLTDANGKVKFTTIYPGWYAGRATHIHIEVFVNNVMKKTTQIAFPESVNNTVYASSLYSSHGTNPISNAADSVFGDSASDLAKEIVSVSGDTSSGYSVSYTLGIVL